MGSPSDELREKLQVAFSGYKFRDERCGMCSVDADADLLAKRLAKKPLREFTADDTLSYCRLLQCQPDTGAKFIFPKLLELRTTESERLIHEKYQKLRLHFTPPEQLAVDGYSENEWHTALGTRDLATILSRLSLIKILSGRIEPFLAEWLGSNPPPHAALVEFALSFWKTGVPEPLDKQELQDWLLTDVVRGFQRAADAGQLPDRTQQALGLLRAYSGQ
jgi:hypothetical protein